MDRLRVGVIGCGSISGTHFHALRNTEFAKLAAVCDIRPDRMEKAAKEQGVKGFLDWRELAAQPDIDAVHVCVPHYLHAEISIGALKAGKHVLCEKPMGMTLKEAQAMEQAARESGKTLTVCFQNRYNGASQRIKQIIDGGELGQVLGGSGFVCWDRDGAYYTNSGWRGKWETEGGSVLINQSIHTLDLMRWLVGGFALKSATMTAKRLADTIETEDTCDMLLENERGGRFLLYCTVCAVGNMPVQLHLKLEKGEIHMDGSRLTIVWPEETVFEDYAAKMTVGKDYWGASHEHLIREFYRAILAGEAPYVTPADALETTRIMEQAYLSASQIRKRPAK
ncbi:MAG: Gfo/Idh/MocA family oxidoreductase [Clostridia bacterium]|nr:Gfo/Idh/MocA family oxidoreductase [Clostridia bacterium]